MICGSGVRILFNPFQGKIQLKPESTVWPKKMPPLSWDIFLQSHPFIFKSRGSVKRARLIIGDRHQLMAESIKGLVEPSYEVVETVFDFNSLPMAVQNQKPDVLVVDFSLFFNNGSNLMQVFKKKNFDI